MVVLWRGMENDKMKFKIIPWTHHRTFNTVFKANFIIHLSLPAATHTRCKSPSTPWWWQTAPPFSGLRMNTRVSSSHINIILKFLFQVAFKSTILTSANVVICIWCVCVGGWRLWMAAVDAWCQRKAIHIRETWKHLHTYDALHYMILIY